MKPWEFKPERYEALFEKKCFDNQKKFTEFTKLTAQHFPSPKQGFRVRAEFRLWHEGDDLSYVMFDPENPSTPVEIDLFPQALPRIAETMPKFLDTLRNDPVLRQKVFQVEFLELRNGELLLTLLYYCVLDESWQHEAAALAGELNASVIGRSRKQKILLGRDYVEEDFSAGDQRFRYRAYEQSFVQPNATINQAMLTWIWERAAGAQGELLELYCGNGNFTLPLARRYRRVLATEVAKISTRAAKENLSANNISNVDLIRLSAEEATQALNGEREFKRLQTLKQPIADYDFKALFVDPPRQGLDQKTCALAQRFDRIYYVSCSPRTLRENLKTITKTHTITALAFFDQFPYSDHLESAVVLDRHSTV